MVYQLKPKRLRVLWPSKYRNDTFFISVTDSLDEDGITGYADIKDIKVFIFLFFYYNKKWIKKILHCLRTNLEIQCHKPAGFFYRGWNVNIIYHILLTFYNLVDIVESTNNEEEEEEKEDDELMIDA